MRSVFVIEEIDKQGRSLPAARYYYNLSSFAEIPDITTNLGKAVALDGATWNEPAAESDAEALRELTGRPMRVRKVSLNMARI